MAIAALTYLVGAVFFPVLRFGFVDLDVSTQVVHNPYIRGLSPENIRHILTSRCVTSYYPVRTLSYALDYQIWGMDPTGFALTNLLLHLANTLLVFWLALRLLRGRTIFAAAFGAAVFAMHPVVVEPVAWTSGREELLMTLGALAAIHFHLAARQVEEGKRGQSPFVRSTLQAVPANGDCPLFPGKRNRAWALHAAAAVACAAACLSNAVGAVIPLLVVAMDLLIAPRPTWRKILGGTAVLWVIGAATLVLKHYDLDQGQGLEIEPPLISAVRLGMVLKVYWLNLMSLVWPARLACSYGPVLPDGFGDPMVVLGGIAVILSCTLLWWFRRRKDVLLGLVWFALALGPTSQVLPHHVHRADRFLYLPLAWLAVAVAMGIARLFSSALPLTLNPSPARGEGSRENALPPSPSPPRGEGRIRWSIVAAITATATVLVAMDWRSSRQVRVWQDRLSLWENCVAVAPASAVAHSAYADALKDQQRFEEAIVHYREALRLKPDLATAMNNYAGLLANCGRHDLRDYPRAIELAQAACEQTKWRDNDCRRTLATAHTNCGTDFYLRRRYTEASDHFRKAVENDGQYHLALLNLALLEATCPETALRNPHDAVKLAERANALKDQAPNITSQSVLAAAYAAAGRFDDAVRAAGTAIGLAQAAGSTEMIAELQRRQKLYENHEAYREQ